MSDHLKALSDHVTEKRGGFGIGAKIAYGELTLTATPDTIIGLLKFLRDDPMCRFLQLTDICGVDYPAARSASTSSITCSACTGINAFA